jgi:hypothetical protein
MGDLEMRKLEDEKMDCCCCYRQAEVELLSVGLGDCLVQNFESGSAEAKLRHNCCVA